MSIDKLTGLRGFAALIVVVSHASNSGYLPGILGYGFGQVGVMLFFILSGFLMGFLYLDKDFGQGVRNYLVARVARIFPLYWLILVASFITAKFIYPDFWYDFSSTKEFLLSFAFIRSKYELWTIPVEIQFYAIFCLLWFCLQHKKLILFIPVIIVSPVLAYSNFLSHGTLFPNIFTYIFSFLLGVLLSRLYKAIPQLQGGKKKLVDYLGLPVLILFVLNLPVLRHEYGLVLFDDYKLNTWLDPLTWILTIALFMCALSKSNSLKLFDSKPFVYLGTISFGMYLIHRPVLVHFPALVDNGYVNFGIVFAVVLLLSHLSFHFWELKMNHYIKKRYG